MNSNIDMNTQNGTTAKTAAARLAGAVCTGFLGIIVLPVLGILCGTFAAVGIGLPLISILNLIGLSHIPFNVLLWQIVGFPQVLVAVIVGVVFLCLSLLCRHGIKQFFAFAANYSKWTY